MPRWLHTLGTLYQVELLLVPPGLSGYAFPVLLFSLDSVPFSDPADFLKACLTKNRWPQYSSAASHPWAKETKLTLSKE